MLGPNSANHMDRERTGWPVSPRPSVVARHGTAGLGGGSGASSVAASPIIAAAAAASGASAGVGAGAGVPRRESMYQLDVGSGVLTPQPQLPPPLYTSAAGLGDAGPALLSAGAALGETPSSDGLGGPQDAASPKRSASVYGAWMGTPRSRWGWLAAANSATRMKYLSLLLLVVQNSAHALLIRYSRTTESAPYLPSTTVVIGEIIKFVVSAVMVLREHGALLGAGAAGAGGLAGPPGGTAGGWRAIRHLLLTSSKTMVPAALYALQNNLIFVALSNLDAATFQVMYQSKIITTALFSVTMLHKSLSVTQWIALLLLFQGVILVQTPSCAEQAARSAGAVLNPHRNVFLGLVVVIAISVTSGFAGVYFEKILKSTQATSLYARNLQLSAWGLLFSVIGMLVNDGAALASGGFFQGYTFAVWLIIFIAAFGGLLIAVVVKYTDNIAKGFATSISIIVSSVISAVFFQFELTTVFVTGASIVILSVLLYSEPDKLKAAATAASATPVLAAPAGLPGGHGGPATDLLSGRGSR